MTNASPIDVFIIPDTHSRGPYMSVFDDDQTFEGLAAFANVNLRQLIHPDPTLRVIIYDQSEVKKHHQANPARIYTINPHVLKYNNITLYGPVVIARVSKDNEDVFVDIEPSIVQDWPSVMNVIASKNQQIAAG